jgi:hypothetical protein
MKKSVIFNYNSLLKIAGGAMPIFDYSKPFFERSGPR